MGQSAVSPVDDPKKPVAMESRAISPQRLTAGIVCICLIDCAVTLALLLRGDVLSAAAFAWACSLIVYWIVVALRATPEWQWRDSVRMPGILLLGMSLFTEMWLIRWSIEHVVAWTELLKTQTLPDFALVLGFWSGALLVLGLVIVVTVVGIGRLVTGDA